MDLKKILEQLHSELATQLLARIKDEGATASDLNVARQFLKDNGIDSVPKSGTPMHALTQALPFTPMEDEDAVANELPA